MNQFSSNTSNLDTLQKGSGNSTLLATSGWDLLAEEVSFPIAVLSSSAIDNNLKWMQAFARQCDVDLAPHGKTTMAPALFKQQIEAGSWAISLATVPQVLAAAQSGIKRIILANQLIGRHHFEQISQLLSSHSIELYCFVDSVKNIDDLGQFFSSSDPSNRLRLLVEVGVEGGRCGCRDPQQVAALCQQIKQYPALALSGLAFYEGVMKSAEQVSTFVKSTHNLIHHLNHQHLFSEPNTIITGAGSAWYDLVVKHLQPLPDNIRLVLRPGCYVIHDAGIYQSAQNQVLQRSTIAQSIEGELINSLQVWAYVQSVPEPGLAIIAMGKRDVAFDAGLPQPQLFFRPSTQQGDTNEQTKPTAAGKDWTVFKIMDQHSMLRIPSEALLQPGDLISFSTSHPCLTMDKWRKVAIMGDDFYINQVIDTYF